MTYNQSIFLLAFDPCQLPTFSASKTSPIDPWVNTYESQYILSLAERLHILEWPVISMDQQFRMLPGLMDPAREVFYAHRNNEDVIEPGADTSIAAIVKSWAQMMGALAPPSGKFWPVFLNIRDTECKMEKETKSSINKEMWERFFGVLWHDLAPNSGFRVPWDKICIITPYRAMTNYIQEYLHRPGLDLTTSTIDPWDTTNIPTPAQDATLDAAMGALVVADAVDHSAVPDGPEPTVRMHNPMSIDVATIGSYQGQEKDLVFFFSIVSASSRPKFVANPNRICIAFTRMRYALIVVGDLATRTKSKKAVTDDGLHLDTRAFNALWRWFPENERVVQWR